ncbi:MAG TPA: ribosomal protein S18-alanine N-acetyltransferase [Nannocystaceae bacterium]|nr:ribosomal protein S18-alanine N-acetyltransferase [Nannocystaceae bacterium]
MSDEIRSAHADDLDAIAAIEAASFDRPWTREIFAQELARSIARLDVLGTPAIAFACTWHVVDEAHLLRIAVAPEHRRRGLARVLVRTVLARAAELGCTHVDLEVAADNAPALALYHALGFVEVGRRTGYYATPPADALLMRATL